MQTRGQLKFDERALTAPGEPALIGVSGGRDSVALLHALLARGERHLVVCHFDHGWRAESAQEAEWVRKLAERHGLEAELGQAQGGRPSAGEKRSVASRVLGEDEEDNSGLILVKPASRHSPETAARHARYRFFAEVAQRRGCSSLYLAHHADDQVETFFFNLLRGAGGAGLCGMHPVSAQMIEGVSLSLQRPLLGTWREEIDAYIAAHGLSYCEDPSNAETRHTRNRLRHEILPMVEAVLGRKVREPLWRAAEIATVEDAYLAGRTPRFVAGADIEIDVLKALPLAMQRRAIHTWLRASGVPNVGFAAVEDVVNLCHQVRTAKVNLPADWHARRRQKLLFLQPPAQA